MKRLLIIAALAASPALADGPSAFVDPPVAKPRCINTFLFWNWESRCDAFTYGYRDHDTRDNSVVDHIPPSDGPTHPDKPSRVKGNPGNDKPVGRAGEKIGKGMAERGTVGNRGKSN